MTLSPSLFGEHPESLFSSRQSENQLSPATFFYTPDRAAIIHDHVNRFDLFSITKQIFNFSTFLASVAANFMAKCFAEQPPCRDGQSISTAIDFTTAIGNMGAINIWMKHPHPLAVDAPVAAPHAKHSAKPLVPFPTLVHPASMAVPIVPSPMMG